MTLAVANQVWAGVVPCGPDGSLLNGTYKSVCTLDYQVRGHKHVKAETEADVAGIVADMGGVLGSKSGGEDLCAKKAGNYDLTR